MTTITLTYSPERRKIEKDVDGVTTEIDAKEAAKIFETGQAADWNLAFYRLAMAEYDKDEVQRQYDEMEANRN